MNKSVTRFALVAALLAASASSACQDAATAKKIDELSERVSAVADRYPLYESLGTPTTA